VFVLRERIGKFERACDCIALDGVLLLLVGNLQLRAECVDRGVSCSCRLRMLRVSVSRALILFGRLAEILVLQKQVRKLIVDGCRISLPRKGLEVGAVPLAGLAIIRELLVCVVCVLILGVIMRREVFQVRLQVGQNFRRLFRFEMSPVFGLQAVLGSELPLRLQYQLGEPAWVKVSTTRMLKRGAARWNGYKALRMLCTSSPHRRSAAFQDSARQDWK